MGRRHPIAGRIDDQARQQARRLRAHRQRALVPIGDELLLHDAPELQIEDGRVLDGIGCVLVNDVATINPILQHQIDSFGSILSRSMPTSMTIAPLPLPWWLSRA